MSATNRRIIVWGAGADQSSSATAAGRVLPLRRQDTVETLRKRYSEVTQLAARLIEECRRLRSDNDDLRGSAEIWIRMYERQLERANTLDARSEAPVSGPSFT
jgi:hypothetical protein